MNITADIRDFGDLTALWQRAPEITRAELLTTMRDTDVLIQGEVMRELPAGAGGAAGLRGSVFRDERVAGETVLGLVATDKQYGPYVELGTKPHMPPIQPLIDWVRAKTGERDDEAKSHAFAIAHAIRVRGTKAQPVWKATYDRLQNEIRRKFDAGVARIVRRLAGAST